MEAGSGTTRLISIQVSEETLKADLGNYRQKAMELGASQVEIIPADWVQVDERVRLKCSVPPCANYNRCGYCPPYTPEPEFMRRRLVGLTGQYYSPLIARLKILLILTDTTLMGEIIKEKSARLPLRLKPWLLLMAIALPWALVLAAVGIRFVTVGYATCWIVAAAQIY